MTLSTRWAPALLAAATLTLGLAQSALAAPPTSEETVGQEGAFTVIVFRDGKKFNRCILHQGPLPNALRIATNGKAHTLSVPTAGQKNQTSMGIYVDGRAGAGVQVAGSDKDRTWTVLSPEVLSTIKQGKKTIEIELGTKRFKWKLNPDMGMAFIVLDSCAEGYTRGA